MRVSIVVAPKNELHALLADFARALAGARVLGVLGEDVMPEEPRDVSHRRPVLIGIPGCSLACVASYRAQLEQLAATHGSWEVLLLSPQDAPQSLSDWLEQIDDLSSFEDMLQYVRSAGSLLEYVNHSPTKQRRLLWAETAGEAATALGLLEAQVSPEGRAWVRSRDGKTCAAEVYLNQASGLEQTEKLLITAFETQLQLRTRALKGVLYPYARVEPSYDALLGEQNFVPLEAHRPGPRAHKAMLSRLSFSRDAFHDEESW